jgi:hypothetical protein
VSKRRREGRIAAPAALVERALALAMAVVNGEGPALESSGND